MTTNSQVHKLNPWYREPWPWYLMAGPAIVVVAGAITAWLAIASDDGLVTDDYYKQGLAIEQTLARSREAKAQGLEVRARFNSEGVFMGLKAMNEGTPFSPPPVLRMSLSHPTRAGLDQTVLLNAADGGYSGKFRVPASGHWIMIVEDEDKKWRIVGNVVLPALGEVVLGGDE